MTPFGMSLVGAVGMLHRRAHQLSHLEADIQFVFPV